MSAVVEGAGRQLVDLELDGMTCASCAARIERKLNKLDGVDATVNFATERAAVAYDPERVDVDQLIQTVSHTGYGASLARSQANTLEQPEVDRLRRRLILAI